MTATEPRRTGVRSVVKAVQLLRFVAEESVPATATEIAKALGLPTPTAYHLLNTLVAEGLLAKNDARRYTLGPTVGLLADGFLNRIAPPRYLLGPLQDLADETGETAYLSGWRDGEIVVLRTVEGNHPVHVMGLRVGYVGAAHARATGKLLLAFASEGVRGSYLETHALERYTDSTIVEPEQLEEELTRIVRRGYALEEEEFSEGVSCIAAPVHLYGEAAGGLVGAFTLAVPTDRFDRNFEELVAALLRAVAVPAPAPLGRT
ncbi:MAG TPA: IclR family transcriptional regulator [Solirubrobacterales bacterium]